MEEQGRQPYSHLWSSILHSTRLSEGKKTGKKMKEHINQQQRVKSRRQRGRPGHLNLPSSTLRERLPATTTSLFCIKFTSAFLGRMQQAFAQAVASFSVGAQKAAPPSFAYPAEVPSSGRRSSSIGGAEHASERLCGFSLPLHRNETAPASRQSLPAESRSSSSNRKRERERSSARWRAVPVFDSPRVCKREKMPHNSHSLMHHPRIANHLHTWN